MTTLIRTQTTLPASEPSAVTCLEGWPLLLAQTEANIGDARLKSWWYTNVEYEYPSTWTIEEAREAGSRFLSDAARFKCVNVILSVPDELIEFVCPQIEEIVEYETRMRAVKMGPSRSQIQQAPFTVNRIA